MVQRANAAVRQTLAAFDPRDFEDATRGKLAELSLELQSVRGQMNKIAQDARAAQTQAAQVTAQTCEAGLTGLTWQLFEPGGACESRRSDFCAAVTKAAVLAYLAPRIVKWWTPDDVVFAPVPLTATGKIDKKVLREAWRGHLGGA